jgi:hypothetical protein
VNSLKLLIVILVYLLDLRVARTRYRIDTINSHDDGHMAARNMQRIEINVHNKGIVREVSYLQRV